MPSKRKKNDQYKVLVAAHDQLFGGALIDFIASHNWPVRTQFHVIHIIEDNPLKKPLLLPQDVLDDLTEEEELAGMDVLNFMAKRIYLNIPHARVARHLVRGDATQEILRMAKDLPAKVIFLGSHGRAGIERLILGSVASAVVSRAPCSTVVLRLTEKQKRDFEDLQFSVADMPERMREELDIQLEQDCSTK